MASRGWLIGSLGFGVGLAGVIVGAFAIGIEQRDASRAELGSCAAYAGLPAWHRPERVVELATLVVTPRDGYPDPDPDLVRRSFPDADACGVVVLDGPRLRLSASEIRRRAGAGHSLRYLVPDVVAAYIGDHALYRTPSAQNA